MESKSITEEPETKVAWFSTDIEIFIECYRRFGIECKVDEGSSAAQNFRTITLESPSNLRIVNSTTTYSERIQGSGYTKLVFTKEGKFIEQGIWE